MKKFATVSLALLSAVCVLFAATACDAEPSVLKYEAVGDGYAVVGFEEGCTDTTVVIPAKFDGKPVTEIGAEAFFQNDTIEEVVLPKSIKRIGEYSFYNCPALRTFTLPDGITELGEGAFAYCNAIESVHIPASVETFGIGVFMGDEGLTSATLEEGLSHVGEYLFSTCTALSSVNLPEGITRIEYAAFQSCAALTEIAFPASLVDIEAYAFYGTGIENVVTPQGLRHIGSDAFGSSAVKTVTLNNGLRSIAQFAFSSTAIESIDIPDTVTDLGIQCFYKCKNLKSAKIGQFCNYLPYGAFALCTSLETVIVPQQLDVVDSAFAGCENIKDVFYESEEVWQYYTVGDESNENEKNMYGNKYYMEANFYLYSEEPNPDGQHWHYNANNEPELWT